MTGFLLERLLSTPESEAVFSDAAYVGAMLRFEAALARAQASVGVIPALAAEAIARCCAQLPIDVEQLLRAGRNAGSIAIPLVKTLTEFVVESDARAARYVHYGATSQDVLDSALALCSQQAVNLLAAALARACAAARKVAEQHRSTPMLARTLMQPAGVTTAGYKFAQWSLALAQARWRMQDTARVGLAVSLGGAAGDLAQLGEKGAAVRRELARTLELHDPETTWHSLRGPWLALACDIGLVAASLAKIAHDIALMTQAEVAEVAEPEVAQRGGSTAMPHKRNPVLSMRVLAATQAAPALVATLLAAAPQEHERGLGNWQAEIAHWPRLLTLTLSAAQALAELLEGLRVDEECSRGNIEALRGVIFADKVAELLSPVLGKTQAQAHLAALCARAQADKVHLRELVRALLASEARYASIDPSTMEALFDVERSARPAASQVDFLLAKMTALL